MSFEGQQAVHIGPGAFSLGHIIPFYDQIGLDVRAISLRSDTTKQRLADANFDFTVVARDAGTFTSVTPVTALKSITVVPPGSANGPDTLRERARREAVGLISDPATTIISLTVTIDGYGYSHNPSKKVIDETGAIVSAKPAPSLPDPIPNPQAVEDSETTIAFLAAGLNERMKSGAGPVVVMSLDNMPLNGTHLYRAVKDFALANYGRDLHGWIKENTFFPDTMVDRIVPVQKKEIIEKFVDDIEGVEDTRLTPVVVTEKLPTRALVISTPDQAALEIGRDLNPVFSDHPVLNALFQLDGVEQCPMANEYSERKVHVFNGAHFGLALVGRLAGYTYAHEAIEDPAIRQFIEQLLDELSDGAPNVLSGDATSYKQEFIDRVSNPHMMDELQRIGRNGSSKLYERVLIPWYLATSKQPESGRHDAIDTVGAAWIKYLATATQAQREGIDFAILDDNAIALGLVGLDPLMYDDAHSILGKKGVMDHTPGAEEFGTAINEAFPRVSAIVAAAGRGTTVGNPHVDLVAEHALERPFERPGVFTAQVPNDN